MVDGHQGYSVEVSLECHFLVEPSSKHYYVVNLKAGRECWTVYVKLSDVTVLKTDLEKEYPALRPVFEKHAALFNRLARDIKKQPTKQELKVKIRIWRAVF